jgi:hypothetical protein
MLGFGTATELGVLLIVDDIVANNCNHRLIDQEGI